jgi:hypothetical protein
MKTKPQQSEPAFALESDDRFHSIIVSSPVRYTVEPDAETIITFFVIKRASGLIDIFHVLKHGNPVHAFQKVSKANYPFLKPELLMNWKPSGNISLKASNPSLAS